MIQRRSFLTLVGGTAAAWPMAALAQQDGRVRRIGVLVGFDEGDAEAKVWVAAFAQGLADLGWKEGSNLRTEYRWAGVNPDHIRSVASELLALNPEVILATNTPTATSLLQLTRTIPVVFANVADPMGSRLISSLPRPGGNFTGFMPVEPPMAGKWVSLLKELVPGIGWVAFIHNPASSPYAEEFAQQAETAARSYGIRFVRRPINEVGEIDRATALLAGEPNGSLIVLPDAFTNTNRSSFTAAAARYRLPAIYAFRFFAVEGGLMSYGNDVKYMYRSAATYIDRILKGAKPADLPVQAPTKFEWVINLKVAKALGIAVPNSVLLLVDEVIE